MDAICEMTNSHDQGATCIPCCMENKVIKMSPIIFVKCKYGRASKACNKIFFIAPIKCLQLI